VLDASAGAWAQVRAVNGWRGWVDGRLLAAKVLGQIVNPRAAEPVAATAKGRMDILDSAYLVRDDPKLEGRIRTDLDEVAKSEGGTSALVERLFRSLSLAGGRVRVADLGDMTWNELLKLRMVVEALGRSRSSSAVARLSPLLIADCDYGQFNEILRPAVARALGEIGTGEAVNALKDALARTNLRVETTVAIQEALAKVQPAEAAAANEIPDISKRAKTGKVGCVGFRFEDPASTASLRAHFAAFAAATGGSPARVDAVFAHLRKECTIVHPYVYETTFSAARQQVNGDVVLVIDFEDKYAQFEKKMDIQNYASEIALLQAFAVNAKALELTVQFLSRDDDVVMTL